jgi:CheY-like chemotaxis protein
MEDILVIDDNHNILTLLENLLNWHGYSVKIAHDGMEGMQLLNRENSFKLVITDICMPGADGNQVAKHVRGSEKMRETPIIGITGYPGEIESALFDSIVEKPFKIKKLIEVIHSLI